MLDMRVGAQPVGMREFFTAGARALVDAQIALDADASATLVHPGVPSLGFAYTRCMLRFPVSLSCTPSQHFAEPSVMTFAPASVSLGGVRIGLRLVSTSIDTAGETHDETS